jgi:3-hydroxybutyryl-CoA dehydrogenase
MRKIAIIGAGTMGHALALVHALGGSAEVRLQDIAPAVLERAPGLMATALATLREAGAVGAERDQAWLSEIVTTTGDLAAAVAGADLIVEAVVEDPEIKRQVFAAIDAAAPESAVIASNTSYLDVFPLIPARRQRRAVIAHWYTPPYLVDLVDIAPGPETDPAVIEALRALYAGMEKKPVVLRKFVPGFIANRIQAAISLEVYRLLDEGVADTAEIDASVKYGLALRMPLLGHLMKADFTGLAMSRHAQTNRSYTPPPVRGRSERLDTLVEAGHTGVMAGRGFYDYRGRSPAELMKERDLKLLRLKQALKAIGDIEADPT